MADVTITAPTRMTAGTKTAALVSGGQSVTTGQTFDVALGGDEDGLIWIIEDSGGSATPITFDAGDYPPAALQGKGAVVIAEAASQTYMLVLEQGRHMKNTGKIAGSATGGTVKIKCFYMPAGYA